jgi:hypothetical protein
MSTYAICQALNLSKPLLYVSNSVHAFFCIEEMTFSSGAEKKLRLIRIERYWIFDGLC